MTMKHYTLVLGLCLTLFGSCSSDDPVIDYPRYVEEVGGNYDDCRLVWSEEFDYEGLPDEKIWDYEEGYKRNYEMQDYKKADSQYTRVENGALIVEVRKDPHDAADGYHFDYTSASLHTKDKVSFKYGRIDIAAKLPVARGMYPVFWMLPVNDEYGAWPKSGEMNIAAYTFGGYWGNQYEKNTVSSWLHTENIANGFVVEPGTGSVSTMQEAYHLYSMVWKKKRIQFLLDNKVVFTYDKRTNTPEEWPFNKDFYLLMSLAVGGVQGGAFGVDGDAFPQRMEVDYVRYYEMLNDEETDEVEDPNLIKNGGFEQDFEAGKEPAALQPISGVAVLEQIGRWYSREGYGNKLTLDNVVKKSGNRSLKLEATQVKDPWDIELSFPITGCEEGNYTFSFWMKSNKEQSPFVASVLLCETKEDIERKADDQKTVWVKTDGTQVITTRNAASGGHPQSTIYNKAANTEWQKFSVTVKLPQTELIRFVIRPNVSSSSGSQWPSAVKDTDLSYWFDDFSFEKVD